MSEHKIKRKPTTPGQLSATGKDGQTVTYEYTCQPDTHLTGNGYESKTKWCFLILIEQDVFQFDLVDEESFIRVEMMNRNDCARYKARGIAEAFIRLSSKEFKLPICSSIRETPQISPSGIALVAEQHSSDASRVWERLVLSNEAHYDAELKRFVYPAAQISGEAASA